LLFANNRIKLLKIVIRYANARNKVAAI